MPQTWKAQTDQRHGVIKGAVCTVYSRVHIVALEIVTGAQSIHGDIHCSRVQSNWKSGKFNFYGGGRGLKFRLFRVAIQRVAIQHLYCTTHSKVLG